MPNSRRSVRQEIFLLASALHFVWLSIVDLSSCLSTVKESMFLLATARFCVEINNASFIAASFLVSTITAVSTDSNLFCTKMFSYVT